MQDFCLENDLFSISEQSALHLEETHSTLGQPDQISSVKAQQSEEILKDRISRI